VPIGSRRVRASPSTIVENDTDETVEHDEISFDPYERRARLLRSVEGMRVRIDAAQVVGPTAPFSRPSAELVVLPNQGLGFGPSSQRGGLLRGAGDDNPERIFVTAGAGARLPDLDVGNASAGPSSASITIRSATSSSLPPARFPGSREPGRPGAGASRSFRSRAHGGTLNVRNSAPPAPQRSSDRLADSSREPGSARCGRSSRIEDGSGASDDGTTDAGLTYALLVEAISRRGGPLYCGARHCTERWKKIPTEQFGWDFS